MESWLADLQLFNSSSSGYLEGVVQALRNGGKVNMRNFHGWTLDHWTPLMAAADKGHTDICGILLAAGADVNEVTTKRKVTALLIAALRGNNTLVKVFLSWGAKVDAQDKGGATPLFCACHQGHLDCVQTLVRAGANFGIPSGGIELPIQVAASRNNVEVVKYLLGHGCTPDMVRKLGITTESNS